MSEAIAVIPGRGEAANPVPAGRGTSCSIASSHPVVGSGFSLREPWKDRGATR